MTAPARAVDISPSPDESSSSTGVDKTGVSFGGAAQPADGECLGWQIEEAYKLWGVRRIRWHPGIRMF